MKLGQLTKYIEGQMLWFSKNKKRVSKFVRSSDEAFIPCNEMQLLDWPSIVAHSPAGLMHIGYELVTLVHRNMQVTNLTIGYIQFRQGFWVLACGRRADLSA